MRTTSLQRLHNVGVGAIFAQSLADVREQKRGSFKAKVGGTHQCQWIFGDENAVCTKCGKVVDKYEVLTDTNLPNNNNQTTT
jgi:hypothetical protein